MELIRALRLEQFSNPPRVAFVGAGGKTTAIFRCARQLTGPILVTATTHLAVNQLSLADQHYFVNDDLLDRLERDFPPGVTLLTGHLVNGSNRIQGVSARLLERIHNLANIRQVPLLIEADGSRRLPLKAPADHEPPIPGFVDLVVVVAGLRGLGKPLFPDWVHHPEIFASISGLQSGEIITPAAIAREITHPKGGLKNIPSKARRVALLNQADSPKLRAQAATLSKILLRNYDSVVVSTLASQPARHTPQSEIHGVIEPIAAVILAAGEARRFGGTKQLLDWHGKPLIWHVVHKALLAGLDPLVVVTGSEGDAIQNALVELHVKFIHNSEWRQGQGSSVKHGVQAVRARSGGALFLLADQPQIPVLLIRALVDTHAQNLHPITGPMIDGQRANPVLFDRVTFDGLESLSGEVGGRELFSTYAVNWIPWYDPSPLLDVDTPEDYLRLQEMSA